MTNQTSPIDQLTKHYEKVLNAVMTDTKSKAFMLSSGDVNAIEADCKDWIKALRGILVVKETIMGVVGAEENSVEDVEEDTTSEITTTYDKDLL